MEDYFDKKLNFKINFLKMITIYLIIILTYFNQYLNANNLHLIESSLKTFQTHACDGQKLLLNCFDNTVIQITYARYGNQSNRICSKISENTNQLINKFNQTINKSDFNHLDSTSEDSLINCIENLKYSLLQKVEAACRQQTSCQVKTSPETLGIKDDCPNIVKYAEVAFKCRPCLFLNKEACADEQLDLLCPKSKRLLIYSAFLGTSNHTPLKCQTITYNNQNNYNSLNSSNFILLNNSSFSKKSIIDNCKLDLFKEIVDSKCHAQKQCSISTNLDEINWPACAKNMSIATFKKNVYLKVSFACIPKNVLKNVLINSNQSNQIKKQSYNSTEYGFIVEKKKINEQKNSIVRLKEAYNLNATTLISKKNQNDFTSNPRTQYSTFSLTENYNSFVESPNFNYIKSFQDTSSSILTSKIDLSTTVSYQENKEDNIPVAAVFLNENSINPSNNELNSNYRTQLSTIKANNNFLSNLEPTYQYIQHNLERLLIYVLIVLCVALLFCFLFLGVTHLMDKKHQNKQPQCENLECLDQNDWCDRKVDVSSNGYKSNVFSDFEEDNSNDLQNNSFIGISQQINQLNKQLNAQLINKQETINLSPHQHMIIKNNQNLNNSPIHNHNNLISHNQPEQQSIQFINSNPLTSSFLKNKENTNFNSNYSYLDNYDQYAMIYKGNTISPHKINSLPHSATIFGIQAYSPIFYQPQNIVDLVENHQQQQQTCITPQHQQIIISNSGTNQTDNETISNATTTTTLCSQGDNSLNRLHSNEMQISTSTESGLIHNTSSFQPITLQIVSTEKDVKSEENLIEHPLRFNLSNPNHQFISNGQLDKHVYLTQLNLDNQTENSNFQVYLPDQQQTQDIQHQNNFYLNPTQPQHCTTLLANSVTNNVNTISTNVNLKHNIQNQSINYSNLITQNTPQSVEILNNSNTSNVSSNKIN